MAFAPLRFLHASNARLDQAIGETLRLPPRLASIVQDATRAAFDRLVAAAIENEVDFVLLAGNTWIEADQSLAARLSLVDALEQLDHQGIRAVILPGALDPISAWRSIPDLPDNITLLTGGPKGISAFKRDDRVVARLGIELRMPARKKPRTLRDELRSQNQRPVPFKIATLMSPGDYEDATLLHEWNPDGTAPDSSASADSTHGSANGASRNDGRVPVDYVALGGGPRRTLARRRGIAHDPGSLQGSGAHEPGPRGCTLVTVEEDGTVRCDFVPTASVRWERFPIEIPAPFERSRLVERCRTHLEGVRPEPSENAWILQWVLSGDGRALHEAFPDEASRRLFQQELANVTVVSNAEDVVHQLLLHVDENPFAPSVSADPLEADYLEALANCRHSSDPLYADVLNEVRATDPDWATQLEALLGELDEQAIASSADRLGMQLFRTAKVEGVRS